MPRGFGSLGLRQRGKKETILDNEKDEILRNDSMTGRVFRVRRE